MKAIAEMDEDERLNDGAIKIPLDNEKWVQNTLWWVVHIPRMCHEYKNDFLGGFRPVFS